MVPSTKMNSLQMGKRTEGRTDEHIGLKRRLSHDFHVMSQRRTEQ